MNLCSCSCSRAGQSVGEHPFRQRPRVELAVDRRHQDRGATRREVVTPGDIARELVVGPVLDDELHLVVRREPVEIAPLVLAGFAAPGTLDVHDLDDVGRARGRSDGDRRSRASPCGPGRGGATSGRRRPPAGAARLPVISTSGQSWLSDRGDHLVHGLLAPLVKGIGGIAPGAAQIARRQPDEHAGTAGVGRFPLNRIEDLVDRQHVCRPRTVLLS